MAWLQSSLIGQQALRDSSGNSFRKGCKAGATNKSSDPDNSDTPLLFDSPQSSECESVNPDWLKQTSGFSAKKASMPQTITSKTGFLGCSIFDKGGAKLKSQVGAHDDPHHTGQDGKRIENKKLLCNSEKKSPSFDDDDDDESEDEWCLPRTGGYQKVRPGAD